MITKTGGWTYSYDSENRLTKVVHSGTVQQNFHDGAGNLVKNIETDTRIFAYQGLNTIFEKDTTTATVTKHFYANGIQLAKMVGATNYYMHPDALGSTRLVMTTTLTIQFSSNYRPFGLTYSASGTETFKYTGKLSDSVTGLYYFGASWYDPSLGRFITQDSYLGRLKDPMSLNRYIYARDNPEKYVDPNGHMFVTDTGDEYVDWGRLSTLYTVTVAPPSPSPYAFLWRNSDPNGIDRGGDWYPTNPAASQQHHHTIDELIGLIISGKFALPGIPPTLIPTLIKYYSKVGVAQTLLAELILPALISDDLAHHRMQVVATILWPQAV